MNPDLEHLPPPDPSRGVADADRAPLDQGWSVATVPPGAGAPPLSGMRNDDPWAPQPWTPRPPAPPKGHPTALVVVIALVAALVGGVTGTAATLVLTNEGPTQQEGQVQAPVIEGVDVGEGSVVATVAAAVTPSVASVETFSAAGPSGQPLGLGSAVIYTSDGYLLTNHHVVNGGRHFEVRLANGDIHEAQLIGSDQLTDLAVLKIDVTGLPAINIRTDPPVAVGETAIAIGSPFGLHTSVTAGVVSALNREITVDQQNGAALVIPSVIQTDAAINPGNSGGALVDGQGRLIGINTAILTDSGGNQGVGFAIPVDQATNVADQLIAEGEVHHPFLGITGVDVTPRVAEEFGFSVDKGAMVDTVQPGTAAAAAGLQPSDIIVGLDGQPINSMSALVAALRRYAPGDEIVLEIVRDDDRLELSVTLGER